MESFRNYGEIPSERSDAEHTGSINREVNAPKFGKLEELPEESFLHMVEGMKDGYTSKEWSNGPVKGVDQAPEGLNSLLLEFRTLLDKADLNEQSEIDSLNALIQQVAEIDPAQAETLKQEFVDKKIS